MSYYTINTPNTAFLVSGEPVVYAGKNGFVTPIGAIPATCSSVFSNTDSIVLTIDGLSSLYDDNFNLNVLDVPYSLGLSNVFIRVPIVQYSESFAAEGSSGYYSTDSNISLEIQSYDTSNNTITLKNRSLSTGAVSDTLLSTPFTIVLNQTLAANNFTSNCLYVSGSYKSFTHYENVFGLTSLAASLRVAPKSINNIRVYLDDIRTTNFIWTTADPKVVFIPSTVNHNQAKIIVDTYTVPAIETNDLVSFSTFNNTYTVVGTSYEDASYNANSYLTSNSLFKIYLDRSISSEPLNYYIVNISQDMEGYVGNLTSNSFTIDYDDSYPYSYSLANTGVYYMYQKNKVKYTSAKLDEYGVLTELSPQNYIVEATTINRYNRVSATVKSLLTIDQTVLGAISGVNVTERIFIDTTGGASISATIEFPAIIGRDVTSYEILYRVTSDTDSTVPEYTTTIVNQSTTSNVIRYTLNNLNRGTSSGSNVLNIVITPLNGDTRGFPFYKSHQLIGKLNSPAGLSDFNVTQQGDTLIYTWQFAQTQDGYILDLDTKEVEIREYPGVINLADIESINATWAISLIVDRIPFPNTTYTMPISKYGAYTYLIRVRDTSNNESDRINASVIEMNRVQSRLFKAYNEGNPSASFAIQDGISFPNSNTYPEVPYPSFNDSIYNGFVYSDSTNVDNANGSSQGFSVDVNNPSSISTTTESYAEYTTQIRDVGAVIRGAIRIKPIIAISSSITYNDEYRLLQSGVTDFHGSAGIAVDGSILVDNAFGGIGYALGYGNANSAALSYNTQFKTLTSGGATGNVFAIRNPGQFANDFANANMFAMIAGVINDNAIQLGEVFFANGRSTGSNNFSNLTISGNTYELVDLAQFLDTAGSLTYLGPTRDIVQNIYVRYSTDNVYYTASANGVPGFPGHGNTNPNAFSGASENASLGFKRYVAGEIDFRYFQIKLQYSNKEPSLSSVVLEGLTYEVDVAEKTFTTVKQVTSNSGVFVNYSFKNYIEPPKVVSSMYSSIGGYTVSVSNVSTIGCNVTVYQSNNGLAVSGHNVAVTAIGI